MKCILKAKSPDPRQLALLATDLRHLNEGLEPYILQDQLFVEFHEKLLIPILLDYFEQFKHWGAYIEF